MNYCTQHVYLHRLEVRLAPDPFPDAYFDIFRALPAKTIPPTPDAQILGIWDLRLLLVQFENHSTQQVPDFALRTKHREDQIVMPNLLNLQPSLSDPGVDLSGMTIFHCVEEDEEECEAFNESIAE